MSLKIIDRPPSATIQVERLSDFRLLASQRTAREVLIDDDVDNY